MKETGICCISILTWIFYILIDSILSATTSTSSTITTTTAGTGNGSLSCYDCSESFKYTWDPYTECQYYPTQAALRECLTEEKYCVVERVTYRDMTVSILRGCTEECWHGCYASGFGLTKLKCTSCCMTSGCNIGNEATKCGLNQSLTVILTMMFVLRMLL